MPGIEAIPILSTSQAAGLPNISTGNATTSNSAPGSFGAICSSLLSSQTPPDASRDTRFSLNASAHASFYSAGSSSTSNPSASVQQSDQSPLAAILAGLQSKTKTSAKGASANSDTLASSLPLTLPALPVLNLPLQPLPTPYSMPAGPPASTQGPPQAGAFTQVPAAEGSSAMQQIAAQGPSAQPKVPSALSSSFAISDLSSAANAQTAAQVSLVPSNTAPASPAKPLASINLEAAQFAPGPSSQQSVIDLQKDGLQGDALQKNLPATSAPPPPAISALGFSSSPQIAIEDSVGPLPTPQILQSASSSPSAMQANGIQNPALPISSVQDAQNQAFQNQVRQNIDSTPASASELIPLANANAPSPILLASNDAMLQTRPMFNVPSMTQPATSLAPSSATSSSATPASAPNTTALPLPVQSALTAVSAAPVVTPPVGRTAGPGKTVAPTSATTPTTTPSATIKPASDTVALQNEFSLTAALAYPAAPSISTPSVHTLVNSVALSNSTAHSTTSVPTIQNQSTLTPGSASANPQSTATSSSSSSSSSNKNSSSNPSNPANAAKSTQTSSSSVEPLASQPLAAASAAPPPGSASATTAVTPSPAPSIADTASAATKLPNTASSLTNQPAGGAELPQSTPAAPAPVQMAQMVTRATQSEMRIGLNTSAFGNVEVHTIVHASDVGLSVGSEKGDLHSLLSNELPTIADSLQQQSLRLGQVNFHQSSTLSGNLLSGGGGQQQQQRSFSSPTTSGGGPVDEDAPEISSEFDPSQTLGRATGLSILA